MQVRLQRPTISAEMSFLLALVKFYVPDFAIASVTPIPFQTQDVLLRGDFTPRECAQVLLSIVALYQGDGLLGALQHIVQLQYAYCQAAPSLERCLSQRVGTRLADDCVQVTSTRPQRTYGSAHSPGCLPTHLRAQTLSTMVKGTVSYCQRACMRAKRCR